MTDSGPGDAVAASIQGDCCRQVEISKVFFFQSYNVCMLVASGIIR